MKRYNIYYHNLFMFPSPIKVHQPFAFNPSPTLERSSINRSAHLPYFKRFPNQKYLSQERQRVQQIKNKSNATNQYLMSPQKFVPNKVTLFQKEKAQSQEKIRKNNLPVCQSLQRKQSERKRFLKKKTQREQQMKSRVRSQFSKEKKKSVIIVNRNKMFSPKLSVSDVLKSEHNLTDYEKEEIIEYEEIYYYGQNCQNKAKKKEGLIKGDGGYAWLKGDHIHFRYEFLDLLGDGSFGEVFKCIDHKNGGVVALKMIKDNDKYAKQARIQVKILNQIKAKDASSSKNCIHLRDFFTFRKRMCITFDLLSINLYELIKSNGYYGLPLDLIRRMALQILNAIHFLHSNSIIHADLKPENILLKETNKSGIRVIDFGSSCYENQTIYTYIQSRYYRAPEVILGLPYDRKIDIWSFACIIAELHLGYPIFAGDDENEQISLLVQVLGLPSHHLSDNAKRWSVFFDSNFKLKSNKKRIPSSKTLKQSLENVADEDFVDFIKMCLEWIPKKRCEALECLKHPWIVKGLPDEIRDQHLKFVEEEEKKGVGNREKRTFFRQNRALF